jgi:hypothetical protein
MTPPVKRSLAMGRRLTKRTLSSLLLYKFLHEYGYDKGEVVAGAIVADICAVVRDYFAKPEELEPGQLIYWCPDATVIRGGRGVRRSGPRCGCWREVLPSIDRQVLVASVDESARKAEHEPDQAS